MRKIRLSFAALAAVTLAAGTAAAGDPKAAPAAAPAAKPAAPAAAPAAKPAAAPAAAPAAGAPAAAKAAVPPPAGGKPAIAPGEPNPAAPPAPAPPPELLAAAKAATGAWKCKGTVFNPDGTSRPTTGIIKTKLDLDKFWLQSSFAESTGKMKYKFTSYRTFDAASKKWTQVMLDNWGGYQVSTSMGPADNVITWEGQTVSMMGTMKAKDTETLTSPKETKMAGQYSKDGKTWVNGYDVTCTK